MCKYSDIFSKLILNAYFTLFFIIYNNLNYILFFNYIKLFYSNMYEKLVKLNEYIDKFEKIILNFIFFNKKYKLPIIFSDYLFNKFCMFFLFVSFICLGGQFLVDNLVFFIKIFYIFDKTCSNFVHDWNAFLYKNIYLFELPFKDSLDHNINSRNFLYNKNHVFKGAFSLGDLNYVKFLQVVKENTQEFDNEYQKRMVTKKKTMGIVQFRRRRRQWWFSFYDFDKLRYPVNPIKMQHYCKYNVFWKRSFIYDHNVPLKGAYLNSTFKFSNLDDLHNPNIPKKYLVNTREYSVSGKDGYLAAPGVIGQGPNSLRIFGAGSRKDSKITPNLKNVFKYGEFPKQKTELVKIYQKGIGNVLIDSKLIYKKIIFKESYSTLLNTNSISTKSGYFNETLLFGKKFNWFKFNTRLYNAPSDELLKQLYLSKTIKYNYHLNNYKTDISQVYFENDSLYPKEYSELYKPENLYLRNGSRVVELSREYVVETRKHRKGFYKNGAGIIRYKPIDFDLFKLKRVPYETTLKHEHINDLFFEPTAYRKTYWDVSLIPEYNPNLQKPIYIPRSRRASLHNVVGSAYVGFLKRAQNPANNGFLSYLPEWARVKLFGLKKYAEFQEDNEFIKQTAEDEIICSDFRKSKEDAEKFAKKLLKSQKKRERIKEAKILAAKPRNVRIPEYGEKLYFSRWLRGYSHFFEKRFDENCHNPLVTSLAVVERNVFTDSKAKFFSYRYDDKYNLTNKPPFIASHLYKKFTKDFYTYRWIPTYKPTIQHKYFYDRKLFTNKEVTYMPYKQHYSLFLKKI